MEILYIKYKDLFNNIVYLRRNLIDIPEYYSDKIQKCSGYNWIISKIREKSKNIIKYKSEEHFAIFVLLEYLLSPDDKKIDILCSLFYCELFFMEDMDTVHQLFRYAHEYLTDERANKHKKWFCTRQIKLENDHVILYRAGTLIDGISYGYSMSTALMYYDEWDDDMGGGLFTKGSHSQIIKCRVPIEDIFFTVTPFRAEGGLVASARHPLDEIVVGYPDNIEVLKIYNDAEVKCILRDRETRRKRSQNCLKGFSEIKGIGKKDWMTDLGFQPPPYVELKKIGSDTTDAPLFNRAISENEKLFV